MNVKLLNLQKQCDASRQHGTRTTEESSQHDVDQDHEGQRLFIEQMEEPASVS